MKYLLFLFPIFLQAQCLIPTHSYRLICADEVRYADSIQAGSRLYISSRNAFVTSPRSVFSLVNGYGQHFIKVTNSANSQKVAINRAWINRIDSTSSNKALIYIKDISVTFTTTESYTAVKDSAIACFIRSVASGLATLSDGDYGDVVVSGGGLVMTVDKPDQGIHNLADGDFSVTADSTVLSLTGTRQITLQTQNIDGWISRYLQTNNSLTLRTNSSGKNSRIFVDTTGANFQFVNGANNASLRIGDSVAVRFNASGSVGQVLTVTSIDGDGRLVINPKTGGSGSANCEQTLTKNSHGFRKWTPIYWNGSAWARPTFDSIIPTYIVIDSTTVNTFKVANCGNYSSSLTEGIYYYTGTSPGYTLTQPEIKVPLFEVSQSRLILQPLVGFQLAGGSGGTADGNGIYSGSDSLSQTDTYAEMAADGSQKMLLGYFPNSPSTSGSGRYGIHIGRNKVGLYNNRDNLEVYDQFIDLYSNNGAANIYADGFSHESRMITRSASGSNQYNLIVDTIGYRVLSPTSNYRLINFSDSPDASSGAISNHIWTAGTSSFLRSQHGVATGTTDGSGDLTVTFAAAMPDATYSLIATVEGTTSYTISVHTKTTGTCKVRFFNPATGAAVTATSVTISYEAKDY